MIHAHIVREARRRYPREYRRVLAALDSLVAHGATNHHPIHHAILQIARDAEAVAAYVEIARQSWRELVFFANQEHPR